MKIKIHTLINRPITSNNFILYNLLLKECIIIDPGTENNDELHDFLIENQLLPIYIILTHEHFDHIWGVENLKNKYPNVRIICSTLCGELIQNSKKNLSLFHDQKGFSAACNDINIESIGYKIQWSGKNILFFSTPGHSDASISIVVDDKLFVGDLIMNCSEVVTKLPTGNKQKLINSLRMIVEKFNVHKTWVYSGHGSKFLLSQICIDKLSI